MNLPSTLERTPGPTLRAASVRISRLLRAAPGRIFDAWLNAHETRRFLFEGRSGEAISSRLEARL